MTDENHKRKKHFPLNKEPKKTEIYYGIHEHQFQRFRDQVKRGHEIASTNRKSRSTKGNDWYSSGTTYRRYHMPLGKFIDSKRLRANAELEDIMLIIEPFNELIRCVRVPRYAGRAILAKACRSGDDRVFCTTDKIETHEISKLEALQKEERKDDNYNRGALDYEDL